jgi:predicted ArsR family transcriptional regulator
MFAPLNVEIIGEPPRHRQTEASIGDVRQRILSTLERRPSTIEDLEKALGLRRVELLKVVDALVREGLLAAETMERGVFYRAVKG